MKGPSYPKSIIMDPVHPKDFRELNLIFCCEQCSFYHPVKKQCAMGFHTHKHTRENQLKLYNLSGKMAFCRSMEID